ncbi:ATP-binding protein, partial [Brunnivagina elsteri]
MSVSNICHFLIGVPGSGKSTFADALEKLGNYVIVSTDEIRSRLYGDAAIQGNWHEIENQALLLIRQAQILGKGVIYDATNFKRAFRMDFLIKLEDGKTSPHWIAWHFKTPIETCIEWNQKRDRQVPQPIIESMSRLLTNFPPLVAEGFAAVEDIDITKFPPDAAALTVKIEKRISTLQRSIINRNNRTQNNSIIFHRYSGLLDFDRLMYLISLIIKYPGIGDLHSSNPNLLAKILGHLPEITSHVDEITKIMAKLHGTIYANQTEINTDLQWLEENGVIVGKGEQISPISPPLLPNTNYPLSPLPS